MAGGSNNISWGERPNARKGGTNPRSATVGYKLTGVASISEAKAAAAIYAPRVRTDLWISTLWREGIEVSESGFKTWDVDVTYGPYTQKEPEQTDFKWGFDTTGGTKHMKFALSHADSQKSATEPGIIDHKGAIGVTDAGDVEGVDVVDRSFKWTESRTLLLGSFAWSYGQVVARLTGKRNGNAFRGLDAGCVLFEGAQGNFSRADPLLFDCTFHFAYQPSRLGIVLGDCAPIDKIGWQYFWVEYRDTYDAVGKRLAKKPIQTNTENVYEADDFALLGIGEGALLIPT